MEKDVFTTSNGQDDSNWHQATIDLSSGYNMVSNFQIRIQMQASSDKDYLYIDDIEITSVQ